jgi:hypothetical protein
VVYRQPPSRHVHQRRCERQGELAVFHPWPEFLRRLCVKDAPENLDEVVKAIWTCVELAMIKANTLTLGR